MQDADKSTPAGPAHRP